MATQKTRIAVFQPEFREDLRHWVETDRKIALRALDLVEAIMRDPFVGKGLSGGRPMGNSTPRRKRMNREARLQSARTWLPSYSGRDVVRGYRKWYGVSTVCAVVELRQLGIAIPEKRLAQAKKTEEEVARRRKTGKQLECIPEAVCDDRDENFAFIAGYTAGGLPYGIRWDELDVTEDDSE